MRSPQVTEISPQQRATYDLACYRAKAEARTARMPAALACELMQGWDARLGPADGDGWRTPRNAFAWIGDHLDQFKAANVREAYDEEAIHATAENAARLCSRMASLESRASFAARYGVEVPTGRDVSRAGACARMDEPRWWRRQFRRVWTRAAENAMRDLGVIRKGRQPYASDEAVAHRSARQQRTREWAERRAMVNEAGEQLDLLPLMDRSLANPALRRGEFMCRMRGFEAIARDLGHVALFFTLTAPSAFHAMHSGGGMNKAWEEAERPRVRDAQAWLRKMWARSRAKLHRLSVLFYGFRVAEPHHDATPHWHMVLFVGSAAADTLRSVLRMGWLSEYANEPGAAEHRCKAVTIDPERGSATGYVAKYVSKNIDGAGGIGDAASDEAPELNGRDNARRVAAWASAHGIRQFQQVGGPPVGLWREARRLRESVPECDDIERARAAADAGDWAGFVAAVGVNGIHSGRRCVVQLDREGSARPAMFAKPAPAALNQYGECRTPAVIGLADMFGAVVTRSQRWRIERKCSTSPCVSTSTRTTGDSMPGKSAAAASICGSGRSGSFSSPRSGVFSDLGPVAITVRGAVPPPDGSFAWVMTVPFRTAGDPVSWTSRETSMAGPRQ